MSATGSKARRRDSATVDNSEQSETARQDSIITNLLCFHFLLDSTGRSGVGTKQAADKALRHRKPHANAGKSEAVSDH